MAAVSALGSAHWVFTRRLNPKVTGMGGCNNFFGSVKIDGNAIEFGPLGATRKACGEAIDDQESRFFQALEKVRSFELDQGLLFLLDNDGAQVLRLSRKS